MSRLFRRKSNFRNWQSWLLGVPVALTVVFLSYLIVRPDPAASHFYRAQKLQSAGQAESALRLYSLIVASLPNSSFAPLALQEEGEILTALARRSGDTAQYRKAIEAYVLLAKEYPSHSLAGEALLAAGGLAANELRDGQAAAGFYNTLLKNYPANAEYSSEATLRLGRIALQGGDGAGAQAYFTRVLGEYARFPERCAEAQYHLGVTYETLLKNKASARSAYEATIKQWPRSVWAVNAKERLGMLLYTDGGTRPARKVLLEIGSLPASSGDSRLAALKLLLAARGLEVSDAIFQGWSLTPFRAGFAPENPARVLDAEEDFATIAANAGLVYSRRNHDDAARALATLRDELDSGHVPFISVDGWALAVGYDSSRDEILLQHPGGERAAFKSKEFAAQWRKSDYSLLSFHAPSETLRATITPKPTPAPGEVAPDLSPPQYLYKLPALSAKNAHRRVLRRAAALMRRPREDKVLLNLEALGSVAAQAERLSAAPPESPIPAPEANAENKTLEPEESTPAPAPAPRSAVASDSFEQRANRWKALRPWFDKPIKNWIEARRDAAAYLEAATTDLGDKRLQRAAEEFRGAIGALQNAADARPAADAFATDPDAARAALAVIAADVRAAHEAEKRATALMQSVP